MNLLCMYQVSRTQRKGKKNIWKQYELFTILIEVVVIKGFFRISTYLKLLEEYAESTTPSLYRCNGIFRRFTLVCKFWYSKRFLRIYPVFQLNLHIFYSSEHLSTINKIAIWLLYVITILLSFSPKIDNKNDKIEMFLLAIRYLTISRQINLPVSHNKD